MKAFIIMLKGNPYSEAKANECLYSARRFSHEVDLEWEFFPGVDKTVSESVMEEKGLTWTWAHNNTSPAVCPHTGLYQKPYKGANLQAKIGCSMSHLLLWERCVELNEPILILEHDAVFIRGLPKVDFHCCQINDPAGATRKGTMWSEFMKKRGSVGVHEKTWVINHSTESTIPDGLAGNSAYMIQPYVANEVVEMVYKVGVWPNDAILNKQLFPKYLQELYPFVTRVNQTVSTSST